MSTGQFSFNDMQNMEELAIISFNSIDTYRTGRINKSQFRAGCIDFLTSAGFPQPNEAFMNEFFRKFDADHSGDIDIEEYKRYMVALIDKMIEIAATSPY